MDENEVRFPIGTKHEGNKITKTCVEDVYKICNRVLQGMDKAYNNSTDIIDSLGHIEYGKDSAVVFGVGVSQPCMSDAFDEEIGNNIAFMKMKLNANIKKHNFLCRIFNEYDRFLSKLMDELNKVDDNIIFDLDGIRQHNANYLPNLEDKLGIIRDLEDEV